MNSVMCHLGICHDSAVVELAVALSVLVQLCGCIQQPALRRQALPVTALSRSLNRRQWIAILLFVCRRHPAQRHTEREAAAGLSGRNKVARSLPAALASVAASPTQHRWCCEGTPSCCCCRHHCEGCDPAAVGDIACFRCQACPLLHCGGCPQRCCPCFLHPLCCRRCRGCPAAGPSPPPCAGGATPLCLTPEPARPQGLRRSDVQSPAAAAAAGVASQSPSCGCELADPWNPQAGPSPAASEWQPPHRDHFLLPCRRHRARCQHRGSRARPQGRHTLGCR